MGEAEDTQNKRDKRIMCSYEGQRDKRRQRELEDTNTDNKRKTNEKITKGDGGESYETSDECKSEQEKKNKNYTKKGLGTEYRMTCRSDKRNTKITGERKGGA